MGGFPSGQRGQTVNLLQFASVVRIHLRPLFFQKDRTIYKDMVTWKVCSLYMHICCIYLEAGFFCYYFKQDTAFSAFRYGVKVDKNGVLLYNGFNLYKVFYR